MKKCKLNNFDNSWLIKVRWVLILICVVLGCSNKPSPPIIVEGTIDLDGIFSDSFDDLIGMDRVLVRLEGQQAKEFWSIITNGRSTSVNRGHVKGGGVSIRFENGEKESVAIRLPQPVVAEYGRKKEIGFWYIREVHDKSVNLDIQRFRALLRPYYEEAKRKHEEKQIKNKGK